MGKSDITVLSVNYNTPDYLERLLFSFRQFYDIPFIIVDGSDSENYKQIIHFTEKYNAGIHHFQYNIHHGPGLAYGIKYIQSEQILLLDSDLIVLKKGFIEDLKSKLKVRSYGIGDIQIVDENGFNVEEGLKYLHPACALINREVVLQWPLPILHGAPMIETMKSIHKNKANILQHESWVTNDFRNENKIFISHDWCGTVNRTGGYNLQ